MKLTSAFTFVLLASAITAHADTVKKSSIQVPDKKSAIHAWTPMQQYFFSPKDHGYNDLYGEAVIADELGDKLSALGRYSFVQNCFASVKPEAGSAFIWAVCGHDLKETDLGKVEAELTAGNLDEADKKEFLATAAKVIDNAKKVGVAVEEAAKTDKGIAAVLALGTAARTEWAAFSSKNKAQLALLGDLQDAVRANKNGLGGDCLKTTQPPFQKLIKAIKPGPHGGGLMVFYFVQLPETPAAYITALSYAACVYSLTSVGQGPYTVAANRQLGLRSMARRGPRSLTVAKAYEDTFNPKFSDREMKLDDLRGKLKGVLDLTGTNFRVAGGTPTSGVVSKLTKKDDETTTISFEHSADIEVPTILIGGIKKGVELIAVFGFPVLAYKPGKTDVITNIWGTAY